MAWLSERWATRYHDHLTRRRRGGREGRRRGATGVVPGEDSVGGLGPVPIAEEASIVGRLAVIRQANHPRACYLNGRRYAVTSQLLPLSTTR